MDYFAGVLFSLFCMLNVEVFCMRATFDWFDAVKSMIWVDDSDWREMIVENFLIIFVFENLQF